jgi:hypothetical protein
MELMFSHTTEPILMLIHTIITTFRVITIPIPEGPHRGIPIPIWKDIMIVLTKDIMRLQKSISSVDINHEWECIKGGSKGDNNFGKK